MDLLENTLTDIAVMNMGIPPQVIGEMGRLDDGIRLPDGDYFGQFMVFHHLHCLVSLLLAPNSMSIHRNADGDRNTSTAPSIPITTIRTASRRRGERCRTNTLVSAPFPPKHDARSTASNPHGRLIWELSRRLTLQPQIGHCLHLLKQAVMCQADTTLITMQWNPDSPSWIGNYSTPHQCVDWDGLVENWVKPHSFNAIEEGLLVHPKFGTFDRD